VAGALQDNQRATILGTRTYGKGSIQTVIPLGNGTAMRLTTAYYRTPRGHLIQGSGVTPDVVVAPQPFEPQRVAQAQTASSPQPVAIARQTSETIAAPGSATCVPADTDTSRVDRVSGDCQIEQALRLLRNARVIGRD